MTGAYQSVFTSIVACFTLIIILGVYKYLYPKKNISYGSLLILISILPLISILRSGVYESGDFTIHVYRLLSFYDAIRDRQWLPQWTENMNATYGYPLFIFIYPLPYYLAAFYHSLGFSFINSIKVVLATSFIVSGVSMYWFLRSEVSKRAAFVGSIFYLFAPIHLVDLHFRIAIGEMLAFVFLPLCFLATKKTIESKNHFWNILCSLTIACLLLSHQAISLISLPMIFLYGLLTLSRKKKPTRQKTLQFCMFLLLGFLLAGWYWIPVVFMGDYTQRDLQHMHVSFPVLQDMFFTTWRYGLLFQGPKGEIGMLIGYTQLFVVMGALYLLWKRKIKTNYKFLLFFSLFMFLCLVFMISPFSRPIWDHITLLRNVQFSYRLLVPLSFTTGVIAAVFIQHVKKTWFITFLILITIGYTILNWGNRRVIPEITDAVLLKQLPLSTYQAEGLGPAMPKWVMGWETQIPKNHLEILSGEGVIRPLERKSEFHRYVVYAKTPLLLKENTIYFPKWTLTSNNKEIPINYTSKDHPGIITFMLPEGLHYLELEYKLTNIQIFSKIISLLSLVFIILYALFCIIKSDRIRLL